MSGCTAARLDDGGGRSVAGLLLASVFLTACPPPPAVSDAGPCDAGDEWVKDTCLPACPAGRQHLAGVCVPATPGGPCDAGTMPVVGLTECQPVGWTACPSGFEPDSSGWGCAPVLPSGPCTGSTRAVLGQRDCAPLGDCAAPFPPPGATLFVDPTGPTDRTHFRTIGAAIWAAHPSSVIAVEAGEYHEAIEVGWPLTLVGRCAEQVRVLPSGPGRPGLLVIGVDAGVSGLTLSGHEVGAMVHGGGHLELSHALLEANSRTGATASGSGTRLELVDVAVRSTTATTLDDGTGLTAADGAEVLLTGVELRGNTALGVSVLDTSDAGAPTRATLQDTVIADPDRSAGGGAGVGLFARDGATVEADRLVLVDSRVFGAIATGRGSHLALRDTVIARSAFDAAAVGLPGGGALAEDGASVELTRAAVVENGGSAITSIDPGTSLVMSESVVRDTRLAALAHGGGVQVSSGASAALESVAVVRSRLFGVYAGAGTHVAARRVLVLETQPDEDLCRPAAVENGALTVTESSFSGAGELGVFAGGADGGVSLTRVLVENVRGGSDLTQPFGHGVLARYGAQVRVAESVLRGCVGVGFIVDGAGGTLTSSPVFANAVGVHAQSGATLVTAPALPSSPGPRELVVTDDTLFIDDVARLGTGTIPVPGATKGP